MDRSHSIMRPAITPVGVLLRRQIRFEDRIKHQYRRRLYHSIRDRGHGQFEPHSRPTALRDGQRSDIPSIRCEVIALRCSSSGALLALTR